MHNKFSILATMLEEVTPHAIQSAVPLPTFKLGLQYLFKKRITILRSDDIHLTATVEGDGERYEQQVYLEKETLVGKCSCSSPERPLCRHCIAVLLEFHRQTMKHQLEVRKGNAFLTTPLPKEDESRFTVSPTLRELMKFVDWLGLAVNALRSNEVLPEPPSLEIGDLAVWAQAIETIYDRYQQSEAARLVLESDLTTHRKQLEVSAQEAKELQATCEELRQELSRSREIQMQIARERDQVGDQLKSLLDQLIIRKKLELEDLTASLRDISLNLEAMTSVPPPQPTGCGI